MGFIFDALRKSANDGKPSPGQHAQGPPDPRALPPIELDAAPTLNDQARGPTPRDQTPHLAFPAPADDGHADLQATDAQSRPNAQRHARADPRSDSDVDADTHTPEPLAFDPGLVEPPSLNPAEQAAPPLRLTSDPIVVGKGRKRDIDERLVPITDVTSLPCEEYRAIRTSLLAKWNQGRQLVHTITSATPQEGKTITSLNLGMTFAEMRNRRTIVVEADLRLPSFGKLIGRSSQAGLSDVLRGKARLEDAICRFDSSRVHFLTAGSRNSREAVHLLSSQAMVRTLQRLRAAYDHVIIDTPPVVEMADAGILGAMSDDVLLIVRMNITPQSLVEQAVRILSSYNAPVSGVIATDQQRSRRKYCYYRNGYRYRYRYGESYRPQRQAA